MWDAQSRARPTGWRASKEMEKKDKVEKAAVDANAPPEKPVTEKPVTEKPVADKQVADPWHEEVARIVRAEDSDPFQILGPHWIDRDGKRVLAIRAFRPGATGATILWGRSGVAPASQIDAGGFFEAIVPSDVTKLHGDEPVPANAYRIQFRFADGNTLETLDPYAFPPLLTDYDLYLWDGRANAMRTRGAIGIWEIFMPQLDEGALYKFEILSRVNHHLGLKS